MRRDSIDTRSANRRLNVRPPGEARQPHEQASFAGRLKREDFQICVGGMTVVSTPAVKYSTAIDTYGNGRNPITPSQSTQLWHSEYKYQYRPPPPPPHHALAHVIPVPPLVSDKPVMVHEATETDTLERRDEEVEVDLLPEEAVEETLEEVEHALAKTAHAEPNYLTRPPFDTDIKYPDEEENIPFRRLQHRLHQQATKVPGSGPPMLPYGHGNQNPVQDGDYLKSYNSRVPKKAVGANELAQADNRCQLRAEAKAHLALRSKPATAPVMSEPFARQRKIATAGAGLWKSHQDEEPITNKEHHLIESFVRARGSAEGARYLSEYQREFMGWAGAEDPTARANTKHPDFATLREEKLHNLRRKTEALQAEHSSHYLPVSENANANLIPTYVYTPPQTYQLAKEVYQRAASKRAPLTRHH